MLSQGLTVLDLRNTLPNLMTLMLSLSYDPSHDDYLAATLSPTGPFASRPPTLASNGNDDDDDETYGHPPSISVGSTEAGSFRTRTSRSGSNASTIRPSRPRTVKNAEADAGCVNAQSVSTGGEGALLLAHTPAAPEAAAIAAAAAATADTHAATPHGRKSRCSRRRSSSNASEKVTLVTTVPKAAAAQQHGRSSPSGSATSNGTIEGHNHSGGVGGGGGSGGGAGSGYGAKLREGLWTVVAGSAGRRESSGPRDAAMTAGPSV